MRKGFQKRGGKGLQKKKTGGGQGLAKGLAKEGGKGLQKKKTGGVKWLATGLAKERGNGLQKKKTGGGKRLVHTNTIHNIFIFINTGHNPRTN